jgi:predicted DNA-binding transcriptional regulator AlpA
MDNELTFWTIKDVLKGQGISRSLWYDQVRMGVAPMPVKTGGRRVAWLKSEVLAYRQKLVEDRDQLLARSGYKADSLISKR